MISLIVRGISRKPIGLLPQAIGSPFQERDPLSLGVDDGLDFGPLLLGNLLSHINDLPQKTLSLLSDLLPAERRPDEGKGRGGEEKGKARDFLTLTQF